LIHLVALPIGTEDLACSSQFSKFWGLKQNKANKNKIQMQTQSLISKQIWGFEYVGSEGGEGSEVDSYREKEIRKAVSGVL
jgi:hypothetical protein